MRRTIVHGDQDRILKPGTVCLLALLLSSPAVFTMVSLHSGRRCGRTCGDGPRGSAPAVALGFCVQAAPAAAVSGDPCVVCH